MIYPIVIYGSDVLRKPCERISKTPMILWR